MWNEYYDLFRLLQTIALNAGVIVCAIFLYSYRYALRVKDPFVRFVGALNMTYILVVLAVTVGRVVLPDNGVVEFAKFVIFTILVIVLGSQLRLRRMANGQRDGD